MTGVSIAPDGSVYAVGYSLYDYKLSVFKFDNNGNNVWKKRLDGALAYNISGYQARIKAPTNNEVYVSFVSFTSLDSSYYFGTLLKLDGSGNQVWSRGLSSGIVNTMFTSMETSSNGDAIYIGGQYQSGSYYFWCIVRYGSDGSVKWFVRNPNIKTSMITGLKLNAAGDTLYAAGNYAGGLALIGKFTVSVAACTLVWNKGYRVSTNAAQGYASVQLSPDESTVFLIGNTTNSSGYLSK
jgi:hypothetical protein